MKLVDLPESKILCRNLVGGAWQAASTGEVVRRAGPPPEEFAQWCF